MREELKRKKKKRERESLNKFSFVETNRNYKRSSTYLISVSVTSSGFGRGWEFKPLSFHPAQGF
jgi:hypothetical protein